MAKRLALEHPVALIDEFQDTDETQYEIFRTIYKPPSTLFLIGDPKQAIYSFRGADIFSYLTAVREAGAARFTLLRNFRSDPRSVAATNALFSRIKLPFLFEEIAFHEGKPKSDARDCLTSGSALLSGFEILFVPRDAQVAGNRQPKYASDRDLPTFVARHIRDFLDSGATIAGQPVLPRDIAVLTRTNAQAQTMQAALRAAGIPSVLFGDSNVFSSDEAAELGFILSAMAEPMNPRAVRAALSTSVFGTTGEELSRLAEDEAGWEVLVSGFHTWHELWKTRGFVQAFRRMLADHEALPRLLEQPGGERKLTNLLHLVELLHQQASERHLGITGLLEWFRDVRLGPGQRDQMAPDAQQIRLESDAHAVKLTTVHRAKGLQYPIVYCPYLWGGVWMFPDDEQFLRYHEPLVPSSPFGQPAASAEQGRKLDIRRKDEKQAHTEAAKREAYAENLRLLYVALTRAQHRTLVVWGAFSSSAKSPLAYVLHQPVGAVGAPDTATEERVKKLDDAAMLRELEALAKGSSGAIGVSLLTEASSKSQAEESRPEGQLARRIWSREIDRSHRGASFSALAASTDKLSLPAEEGRDLDEGAGGETSASSSAEELGETTVLADLPRGVRAGQMLHSIFEHCDFQGKRDETLSALIASTLERYGFEGERLARAVELTVVRTLDTELDPAVPGLRLNLLSKGQRLDELEFTLPVSAASLLGAGASRAEPQHLTARALATAFRQHAASEAVRKYADAIEHLGFAPLTGYLRGFIDLVFEHDGRFYVIDYKSNHLGTELSDYRTRQLGPAMWHHHYYLQYHLYTVAVHRYLARRIPGYDYERHFGGVYYLFLRGLRPELGPSCGVFRDRPALALVQALERALGPLSEQAFMSNAEATP